MILLMILGWPKWIEWAGQFAGGNEQPYRITVLGSAYAPHRSLSDSTLWYEYHTQFGNTISPVQELLFLAITNLSNMVVSVSDYEVGLRTGNGSEIPFLRMNLGDGNLFLGPSLHNGAVKIVFGPDVSLGDPSGLLLNKVDLTGKALDTILAQPLQPHRTVRGLAVFEVPPEAMPDLAHPTLVITIVDTRGTHFSCTIPYKPPPGPYGNQARLESAELQKTFQTADIRDFHRAYFSHFYGSR